MNSNSEYNILLIVWDYENTGNVNHTNSLILIRELLIHKGKGSLYATLMERNYISEIEMDDNREIKTAFKLLTLELTLTDTGMKAFREILAIVFEYLRKVTEEWLADGQTLDLFDEYRTLSKLSYDIYTVPEYMDDHVNLLAENLLSI